MAKWSGWLMAVSAAGLLGCGGSSTGNPGNGTPPGTTPPPTSPGNPDATLPIKTDAGGAVAPSSQAIRFTGRFDASASRGPEFAWPGSAIAIQFTGTSATVRLHQGSDAWTDGSGKMSNEYDVFIDGALQPSPLITSSDHDDYPLATKLAKGVHSLRLVKRTEAAAGSAQFLGFTFDDGATVGPPNAANHRLEFIGDSITAGYGDDPAPDLPGPGCGFSAQTENVDDSYASLTSKALKADAIIEAFQGKGVFRNYDATDPDTMPNIYARVLPQQETPTWSVGGWAPDAVVINLGTNDFEAGDPGAGFVSRYHDFVTSIRAQYPSALVVLALGPMLNDYSPAGQQQLTTARGYLQQVVSQLQTGGDTNVTMVEFPAQDGSLGYGCDYHPSKLTHQQMADQLTAFLKGQLGW